MCCCCVFFDLTDALGRLFVCSAVKSKSNGSRAEKNLVQISPVFEPFGVLPHVLYIFHTPQLPLRGHVLCFIH